MSQIESRTCQSCQTDFTIESDDFAFYYKIQVPPPTWCPNCRAQRRFAWRNESHMLQKRDALRGELTFSNFSEASPLQIYQPDDWYSDSWDPLSYGRDYDFSKPFFAQFAELLHAVPVPSRIIDGSENCDYCINLGWGRNCYLSAASSYSQDCAYVISDNGSRDTLDCRMTKGCELCYDGLGLTNCYRTVSSRNCEGCRNVMLSRDLVSCSDCFGCVNLRGKQYYIWNQPHTKEEYEAKITALNLGSHQQFEQLTQQAHDFWEQFPEQSTEGTSNVASSGEYVNESKNAVSCWNVRGAEDSKYCQNLFEPAAKECYDHTNWGRNAELIYESIQLGKDVYNCKFCWACWNSNRNLQYSIFCQSADSLFGCVSLRKKQYCILNKQYTKEEYEALVPKIIQQMHDLPYIDKQGREYRYGEFFPAQLSPSEYNVTIAQEHFPLGKEAVLSGGYAWHDTVQRSVTIQVPSKDLPDRITEEDSALVGTVIGCAHHSQCSDGCTNAFTLIAQEVAYLLEAGLPLPRLCPNCRHASRLKQRRGMQLQQRQCQCAGQRSSNGAYANIASSHPDHAQDAVCPNRFETSFATERQEIVYCGTCYQAEVA